MTTPIRVRFHIKPGNVEKIVVRCEGKYNEWNLNERGHPKWKQKDTGIDGSVLARLLRNDKFKEWLSDWKKEVS